MASLLPLSIRSDVIWCSRPRPRPAPPPCSPDILQSAHSIVFGGSRPASVSFNVFIWIFPFSHHSLMNNWKDCSICQVLFEGSVLKGLTWRDIHMKWLIRCCWASVAETELLWFQCYGLIWGYCWFKFLSSKNYIFTSSPNYVSTFVSVCCWCFWMLWGGCRCAPNIIPHQRYWCDPTTTGAANSVQLMLILNVRKKGKEGGNKSHLKSGFPPPYMPIS